MPEVDQHDRVAPALKRPRDGGVPVRSVTAGVSRRHLLLGAGGVAAAVGGGSGSLMMLAAHDDAALVTESAPSPSVTRSTTATTSAAAPGATVATGPTVPVLAEDLAVPHLIARLTYGRTAELEAAIAKGGPQAWLEAQLRPGALPDPGGDDVREVFPRLRWSSEKALDRLSDGDWAIMTDLAVAHLGQAAWSSRQLLEVMVDHWSNVLNVTCPSDGVWNTRHLYDRQVIRKHALGRFEDLLLTSAFHPAMLTYLSNADSTARHPNENYAREVLELHTVGVDGGYTERDVQKSALLLTGWTVKDGKASFRSRDHHVGAVKIYGFSHPNDDADGRVAQRAYLRYLAHHPKTAREVCRRLAVRFVSDDPPRELIERLAAVYLREKTAVIPVLRALFASPEFTASAGEKVRRPMEGAVATIRALGVTAGAGAEGLTQLYWGLQTAGHQPFRWSTPDGYPDTADEWQAPGGALAMLNFTAAVVHGWWPAALKNPGPAKLLRDPPRRRSEVADAVARRLLGRAATARERAAVSHLLAGTTLPTSFADGTWQQEETVALTAVVLLNSPAHLTR